jgi:glyoxylase-like metal-dependent hydrolase (beta-lactamase superfamily II)
VVTHQPLCLNAGNPGPMTGAGNNTWLVDGGEPTLIDAGVGAAAHVDAIAAALDGRPLARVIVTHHHADHASGVTALRSRWPGLDAVKWPRQGESGWRAIADGQRVRAGDVTLVVVHTPGHAVDHICLWDEAGRDLYAGDMVSHGATVMIPAGQEGSLRAYLRSLDTMAALEPRRILPGHGPIINQPLELIAAYIAHRRAREEQVRACLSDGVTDIDAIVALIYPGLAEALRPAARMTVQAHLEKLAEER